MTVSKLCHLRQYRNRCQNHMTCYQKTVNAIDLELVWPVPNIRTQENYPLEVLSIRKIDLSLQRFEIFHHCLHIDCRIRIQFIQILCQFYFRSRSRLAISQGVQTDSVKFADETSSFGQICGDLCGSGKKSSESRMRRNMLLIYLVKNNLFQSSEIFHFDVIDLFFLQGNVCSMIGYYTPYLFVVKFAVSERSIPMEKAVFLLSIIGS